MSQPTQRILNNDIAILSSLGSKFFEKLDKLRLSSTEKHVCFAIHCYLKWASGYMSDHEMINLCNLCNASKSNITRILQTLEEKGAITRIKKTKPESRTLYRYRYIQCNISLDD